MKLKPERRAFFWFAVSLAGYALIVLSLGGGGMSEANALTAVGFVMAFGPFLFL